MKAPDAVPQRCGYAAIATTLSVSDTIKAREIMTITLARRSILFAAIIATSALVSVGARAQDAAKCTKASECTGLLPQICLVCRKGHEECAHWACVKHTCKMEICNLYGK
jgi:hypothetical protein